MAPTTRYTYRPSTPEPRPHVQEYDTPKKIEFFACFDRHEHEYTMTKICDLTNNTTPTGRRWVRQRECEGAIAIHRRRVRSENLGHQSKITPDTIRMLLSPSRNPVRNQGLEAQIAYHKLPIKRRSLTTQLKAHSNGGQMYKQAYTKSTFSQSNINNRRKYAQEHIGKTIEDYWQYIVFSDEAHFDPSAQKAGYILRERGTRLNPENIQMRGKRTGVTLHAAGWCNWWDMAAQLTWYHDEEPHTEQPKPPRKPRRTKYQTDEEYNQCIAEWKALVPHPVKVKPQGNSMTGKYYSERILPGLINAIHTLSTRFDLRGEEQHFILQEDNDRSHGHTLPSRPDSFQDRIKKAASIETLEHPPISPDCNPQESVWNILKGRIKKRTWNTPEEYKRVIEEEYSKITLAEVRARILEMPSRMEQLLKHPDKSIKSDLW